MFLMRFKVLRWDVSLMVSLAWYWVLETLGRYFFLSSPAAGFLNHGYFSVLYSMAANLGGYVDFLHALILILALTLYPAALSPTFEGPLHYTQCRCRKLQSDFIPGLLLYRQSPAAHSHWLALSKVQGFVGEISLTSLALLPLSSMLWIFSQFPCWAQPSVYYPQAEMIFGKEQWVGTNSLTWAPSIFHLLQQFT